MTDDIAERLEARMLNALRAVVVGLEHLASVSAARADQGRAALTRLTLEENDRVDDYKAEIERLRAALREIADKLEERPLYTSHLELVAKARAALEGK